ncbi:MAG: ACP S-malonyltransferase [Actinobacteria bacterium]|nr:ACP S-malonyltransferase [Actinomycetota bacterium]
MLTSATSSVMVFPGQGSQYPGMLDLVPENDTLDRLIDAAEALSGADLQALGTSGDIDPVILTDTRISQPLIYLSAWAWGIAVLDSGLEPVAVAGHSLGEFVALSIAGVFSVEAGLELVVARSQLMAEAAAANPGAMNAVLGIDKKTLTPYLDGIEDVWIANDNSAKQVVISGSAQGIHRASEILLKEANCRVIPLKVSGAFHTPMMQSASDAFEEMLIRTEFKDASIPVIQNVDPEVGSNAEDIRSRLIKQMTSPVQWVETMNIISSYAPVVMVEAGPGTVLNGLARDIPGVTRVSVESVGLEYILEEVISQ